MLRFGGVNRECYEEGYTRGAKKITRSIWPGFLLYQLVIYTQQQPHKTYQFIHLRTNLWMHVSAMVAFNVLLETFLPIVYIGS
jgi:hypothetical protein